MGFSKESENEIEQYGAAVGIAISNGLHDEALDLAFTRGGGITVRENVPGTSLPASADLDANAAGGADTTLAFTQDSSHSLRSIALSAYGKPGSVDIARSGDHVTSIAADKDGDGKTDLALQYDRTSADLKSIRVDEDNDGKPDAVLTPDGGSDAPVRGFNVDLHADGTIDGYAEFIRSQNNEVTSIRFRKR